MMSASQCFAHALCYQTAGIVKKLQCPFSAMIMKLSTTQGQGMSSLSGSIVASSNDALQVPSAMLHEPNMAMPATTLVPDACSSLEVLMMVISPSQLGAQLLNHVHSVSGLPWWASIPLATVAMRALLLPLSLRAKASSANVILMNEALVKARQIQDWKRAANEAGAGTGHSSPARGSSPRAMSMWSLARGVYAHSRLQQQVPSFRWYMLNSVVQVSIFTSLSTALARMSSSMWPGLSTEGPPGLVDLTSPAIYLQTLSTPFGTLGAVLPLALVLLYTSSIDLAAGARVPGILAALRVSAVPVYCLALLQPHATLMLWLSFAASHHMLQALLATPTWATRAGLPALLHPPPPQPMLTGHETSSPAEGMATFKPGENLMPSDGQQQPGEAKATGAATKSSQQSAVEGLTSLSGLPDRPGHAKSSDVDMLLFLGRRYAAQRKTEACLSCYQLAMEAADGDCLEAETALRTLRMGSQK